MTRLNNAVDNETKVGAGIDFADPNSPLARYYLRAGDIAAAALIAGVFVLLNYTKLWHTDVWGHLRHGEFVLVHHTFPTSEPFCQWADLNVGTINYAWLSQTLFAGTFRVGQWLAGGSELQQMAGGVDALRFLSAVLGTLRLTLLYLTFVRLTRSSVLAVLGLTFIVVISLGNPTVLRPQVIAELLFAALLLVLSRQELTWRAVLVIPMILAIWCNAHGSFPIGCLAVGTMWAAQLLRILAGPSPRLQLYRVDPKMRRLTFVLLISVAAITFLNPEGWQIWLKTAAMANHPNVRAMDEWQPIWAPMAGAARITYLICLAFIGIAIGLDRERASAEMITFFIAFGIPPLMSQRAVVWFITIAPWIALPSFGRALARHRPVWWSSVPSFRKTLFVGAIGLVALMWSIPVQFMLDRKPPELAKSVSDGTPWEYALAVQDPALVPESELSKALAQYYPDGKFVGTIYTRETLGDFFIWRLTPPVPIFIYSHVHLFTPEHWRRYTTIRDAKPGWRDELNRANINLVIVHSNDKPLICNQLRQDSNWKVIVDETNESKKIDPRCLHFVALRVRPISNSLSDPIR